MNEDHVVNYGLFMAVLASISISIPLIVIGVPYWVILAVSLFMFLPGIIQSTRIFIAVSAIYAILLRPGLYILGLIAAINGPQDFIAIAFYVIAGLQAYNIIKNFLAYTLILIYSKRN